MAMKGRYHEMITAGNLSADDDADLVDNEATMDDHQRNEGEMISKISGNDIDFQRLSVDDDEKEEATAKSDKDSIQYWSILIRTLKLARSERLTMVIASMAALVIGTACPIFGILFGEMYGVSVEAANVLLAILNLSHSFFCLCTTYNRIWQFRMKLRYVSKHYT